jgi:hypothetical protein
MASGKALALGLLIALIVISVHPVRADWVFVRRTYDGTFSISAASYTYVYGYNSEDYKERIDFTCLSGGNRDVYFFICDQENFDLWTSGYTASVYCRQDAVVSWTGEFVFPHSDTWYYVFSNRHSLYSAKTVQLTVDLYQWQNVAPTDSTWLVSAVLGVVTIIVLVAVVVGVVVVAQEYYERSRATPPTAPTQAQPVHPPSCPRCNAPLAGNEVFCANCGARL